MVRKQPSKADAALIAAAGERGAVPTPTQLERWRAAGLLFRNEQHGAGKGRGSVSTVPAEALDLVVWLSAHARPGRRPTDLALEAFGAGLPVPESTVRGAWLAAATDFRSDALLDPGEGADRSDWIANVAEELAAKHSGKSVLLPQRIRDIDARIAAAGIPFSLPELAPFDKGTYDTEPYTSRDFLTAAVSAVLGGSSELSEGDLAAVSRALAPSGAAVPVASMLQYPDEGPQLSDVNDGHGLTLLPAGDARADLGRIVTESSLAQLWAAWQAVDDMHWWAVSLCDTVEAELDALGAGEPLPDCPGLQQWFFGITFGLNRLLLRQALLEPAPSTRARTSTAVMLLFVATGMSRLRVMVPDGQFELLPVLLPPFLYQLAEFVAVDLPASLRRADSD
ncbi:hypothetical protein [Phytohabitans aurantiacus]|uniref:Uncharacterized protein n=1 Tax=Phytohabitans aurantiacus TaxID=3016789 RepID=A0ABQ5R445_9ACTN|nr:hypothetical protein [Phytohabitans aurantiacus]GLI00952.1 hypothetical protein Pa4123_62280 [Phytohabitans aurantiacus]